MMRSAAMALVALTFLAGNGYAQDVLTHDVYQGFDVGVTAAPSQTSFFCIGSWQEPHAAASFGAQGAVTGYKCSGHLVSSVSVAAVGALKAAQTLSEVKDALDAVKTAVTANTTATEATRAAIDQQVTQANQRLYETIVAKFDALPSTLLTNQEFKDAFDHLKREVLSEVRAMSSQPSQPAPSQR